MEIRMGEELVRLTINGINTWMYKQTQTTTVV